VGVNLLSNLEHKSLSIIVFCLDTIPVLQNKTHLQFNAEAGFLASIYLDHGEGERERGTKGEREGKG
jgi:hypothetical protein